MQCTIRSSRFQIACKTNKPGDDHSFTRRAACHWQSRLTVNSSKMVRGSRLPRHYRQIFQPFVPPSELPGCPNLFPCWYCSFLNATDQKLRWFLRFSTATGLPGAPPAITHVRLFTIISGVKGRPFPEVGCTAAPGGIWRTARGCKHNIGAVISPLWGSQ